MRPIVIATCNEIPDLLPSDVFFANALKKLGASVIAAPWNGPFDPFSKALHVVIRSTWDYFDKLEMFYSWFDQLETAQVSVHNSIEVLRWNARKEYLFELQSKGAPIIPTIAVEADGEAISRAAKSQNWRHAVLKCMVSGSALGLSLIDAHKIESVQQALEVARPWSKYGLMLQPFLKQITVEGELSLVFIGGEFSHAVRKVPSDGEFRVQTQYGGQYSRLTPEPALIEQALACLAFAPGMPVSPPLYARVDGLVDNGEFVLMELELTEPELMFPLAPEAAQRMARVLVNSISPIV